LLIGPAGHNLSRVAVIGLLWFATALPVRAADLWRVCLNWAPGADHAPLYLARARGWFAEADLAVELRPGGGSQDAIGKLASGTCESAVADFGAVASATANGNGPGVVAVFALFADSPLAFYGRGPRPLRSPADLRGARIAADDKELARRLWPAFAARNGLDADAVRWVSTPNNAKVDALSADAADIAANTFYHHEAEFQRAFGSSLQRLAWRDHGINPYGNVIAVSASGASANDPRIRRFVTIAQKAVRNCVAEPEACVTALLEANPHLDRDTEFAKWRVAAPLMQPERLPGGIVGAFEADRAWQHHGVREDTGFTNRFLSTLERSRK
jgi:NitT/TauT family transport system substrate-binding protein